MQRKPKLLVLVLVLVLTLVRLAPARAAELEVEAALRVGGSSNVFLDRSAEPDILFRPVAELRVTFGRYFTTGYSGQLTAFADHPDLLSHQHELFLFANPVWGEQGGNELVVEARLETLRNRESYASLNLLRPVLLSRLGLEPRSFFRFEGELETSYRAYYDDPTSSSLDALAETRLVFMLPTRTTLIGKAGYGVRVFARGDAQPDNLDQQVTLGARIGQGLWKKAGLQLDYGYRWLIGTSGLLARKMSEDRFQYLGEDFILGGHHAQLALKQLIGERWTLRATLAFEERAFGGWPAFGPDGAALAEDRRDLRLSPGVGVTFAWEGKGKVLQAGRVVLEYNHVFQWSNSDWYDVQSDQGGLEVVFQF